MPPLALIARAHEHRERTAVVDARGESTYAELLDASASVATRLLGSREDLGEDRVAFMVPSGFDYVAIQWGIWRAGGVAVPLAASHARPELEYVVDDTGASAIVAHPEFEATVRKIAEARGLPFFLASEMREPVGSSLPEIAGDRRAMILYTSGTTSRPKGVVT